MESIQFYLLQILKFVDQFFITPVMERVFLDSLYAPTALAFAFCWFYFRGKPMTWRRFYCAFLSSRIWLHKSVKTDYAALMLNIFLLGVFGLFIEFIASGSSSQLSVQLAAWLNVNLGPLTLFDSPLAAAFFGTLATFLCLDLFSYAFHRWLHSGSFSWKIHSRHHSATRLTFSTNYRAHPLEAIIRLPFTFGISLFVGAMADYLTGGQSSEIVIMGTNMVGFLILFFGGALIHTHIFLCFPDWLSRIVVSPAMHQIHHSSLPQHHNKNFGDGFALWDWLFGTLYIPDKNEKVVFGIGEASDDHCNIGVFLLGQRLYSACAVRFQQWRMGKATGGGHATGALPQYRGKG